MNCDEVTIVNNQTWLLVHIYVIDGWKWVPILLNLQRILDGVTSTNLTNLIMWNLVEFGSMTETDVANKLVCYGVMNFLGPQKWCHHKVDVELDALFVKGVHYMAHCTNMVIQTLSNLSLVGKFESLFIYAKLFCP